MKVNWIILSILVTLSSKEGLSAEYGESCNLNNDCISKDYRDPLVCYITVSPENPLVIEGRVGQNELLHYNIELPEEGITFTLDPLSGSSTGYYSYSNSKPDKSNNDGILPPGTTHIPSPSLRKQQSYTSGDIYNSNVYIGIEGLDRDLNEFKFTLEEGNVPPTTTTTTTTTPPPTTTTTATTETTTSTDSEADTTTTDDPENFPEILTDPEFSAEDYLLFSGLSLFEQGVNSGGVCICPPNMTRDLELNRCVSPVTGKCDVRPNPGTPMRTCSKFASCYAYDGTEGTCSCSSDATLVNATGECKLSYGSSRCEKQSDCNVYNFLTCIDKTCTCLYQDSQKWNPREERCGFVVGASCAKNPPFPDPVCVENAECISDICRCKEDFIETPTNECKLGFNGTCSSDRDCSTPFRCSNNVCTCSEGQTYYESTGKCHLSEGSTCDPISDVCVPSAECQNGICSCMNGFEASSDHTCHALHGSACSDEVPCHDDHYLSPCDASIGTCECQQNYNYNTISQRCVGKLNEQCRTDGDCINQAICHDSSKRCTCGGDLIPGDDNASCYAKYGGFCDNESQCYPKFFLKCDLDQAVCTCAAPDDQTYDDERGFCVAFAGRPCAYSDNDGIECVTNSTCEIDSEDSTSTKCQCIAGFAASETGFCIEGDNSSVGMSALFSKKLLIVLIILFLI